MGRAPCCDKANVKRGPWSPEEDAKLKAFIEHHGTFGNWIALPQKIGLKRCGKSCRLRWLNYLRPNLKHGSFSEEEDSIICSFYVNIGSRWSIIAAQLPGRTDNDIKNYWNTKLKKKLLDKQRKEQHAQARRFCSVKQRIKRESTENLVLPIGAMSQTFWPLEHSFPIPLEKVPSIQDYYNLNNQTSSLKNLQNKLEGLQFSDENQQLFTTNMNSQDIINYFPQDQLYPSTGMNMITPTGIVNVPNGNSSECCRTNIFRGFGNFPNDGSVRVPYEMDQSMASGSTISTSTESTGWGDINSLVYNSPLVSDYEL